MDELQEAKVRMMKTALMLASLALGFVLEPETWPAFVAWASKGSEMAGQPTREEAEAIAVIFNAYVDHAVDTL